MNNDDGWLGGLPGGPALPLPRACEVYGQRDQHLGPTWERAGVRVLVEPADRLKVVLGSVRRTDESYRLFAEAAVMGLLDVLLAVKPNPVRDVRISILRLDIDPIESSQSAFRNAGRDAGFKVIALAFE